MQKKKAGFAKQLDTKMLIRLGILQNGKPRHTFQPENRHMEGKKRDSQNVFSGKREKETSKALILTQGPHSVETTQIITGR